MSGMSLSNGGSLAGYPQTGTAPLTSPKAASWHRVMREAASDVSMLVLGDSTGAGTTRWPYLLTGYLARQYPQWTVVYQAWDDPSKTYPAANKLTVQQGTNGRTVTLWNASVSGQVAGYAQNNYGTITSGIGTPSVIFFNYGHNSPQLTDDYRAVHLQALLSYLNPYPNALVVSIVQNPRVTADSNYSGDQGRQQAIYDMSVGLGLTVVDINEAFRLYGNYAGLLNADGLHPNDSTGSPLWASLVWNAIKPTGALVPSSAQLASTTSIWIPASQMTLNAGTPSLGVQYGAQVWQMHHGENGSVVCSTFIPQSWRRQNITAYWLCAGGAGAVVWTGSRMYSGLSQTLGTYTSDLGAVTQSQPTAAKVTGVTLWNRTGLNTSPISFLIERTGTNASDTLTTDAYLLGLQIERAY